MSSFVQGSTIKLLTILDGIGHFIGVAYVLVWIPKWQNKIDALIFAIKMVGYSSFFFMLAIGNRKMCQKLQKQDLQNKEDWNALTEKCIPWPI